MVKPSTEAGAASTVESERARDGANARANAGANAAATVDAIDEDARVREIVRRGPSGAFAVAGVATAIVVAIYLLFYVVVYLPRGAVQ